MVDIAEFSAGFLGLAWVNFKRIPFCFPRMRERGDAWKERLTQKLKALRVGAEYLCEKFRLRWLARAVHFWGENPLRVDPELEGASEFLLAPDDRVGGTLKVDLPPGYQTPCGCGSTFKRAGHTVSERVVYRKGAPPVCIQRPITKCHACGTKSAMPLAEVKLDGELVMELTERLACTPAFLTWVYSVACCLLKLEEVRRVMLYAWGCGASEIPTAPVIKKLVLAAHAVIGPGLIRRMQARLRAWEGRVLKRDANRKIGKRLLLDGERKKNWVLGALTVRGFLAGPYVTAPGEGKAEHKQCAKTYIQAGVASESCFVDMNICDAPASYSVGRELALECGDKEAGARRFLEGGDAMHRLYEMLEVAPKVPDWHHGIKDLKIMLQLFLRPHEALLDLDPYENTSRGACDEFIARVSAFAAVAPLEAAASSGTSAAAAKPGASTPAKRASCSKPPVKKRKREGGPADDKELVKQTKEWLTLPAAQRAPWARGELSEGEARKTLHAASGGLQPPLGVVVRLLRHTGSRGLTALEKAPIGYSAWIEELSRYELWYKTAWRATVHVPEDILQKLDADKAQREIARRGLAGTPLVNKNVAINLGRMKDKKWYCYCINSQIVASLSYAQGIPLSAGSAAVEAHWSELSRSILRRSLTRYSVPWIGALSDMIFMRRSLG